MAPRKPKIFISNVDGFAALPLDVLCEIFSCLHPIDLLHLARTNKAIRAFVLNRFNAMIWKAAFANNALAGGPPGCPSYMSEPAWARVAFDKSCVGCQVAVRDDPSCDPIWWEFGGRMCDTCLDSATRGGISAKLRKLVSKVDWENVLLRVRKDGSFESNPYGRTPSSRSWFYLAAQQDELLAQLSPLGDKERRQLIEQRTQETAAINAHTKRCRQWAREQVFKHLAEVAKQAREKAAKIEAQKKSRLEQLVKRLNDRGWGDETWMRGGTLLNQIQTPRYPEVEKAKNTTARLASQLDDALIARLTTDKRSAILRERLRTFRERPSHIVEPPASFQLAIVPRRIDIALIPQIRALVDPSGDLDASPTAEQLTAALEPIYLPLLQNWATEALNKVSNHALACLELPPSTPNVLDLAIAVVPCPGKCTHTAQHFRAWRPHPGQSCRAGNRWSNPGPEYFSSWWGLSMYTCGADRDRQVPGHSDPSDEYCTEAEDILLDRPFDPTVYKFATGNVAESLKNIVRAFGLEPETATVRMMNDSSVKWKRVKCVVCEKKETMRKPNSLTRLSVGPHSWQKAIYHCLTAHATDRQPTTWVLCS